MGAACERIGYCSWQQGGRRAMPPRLGVCVWEVASHLFFFISDYSFIFPQILKFLRGRVLPRKITNLGLLSHIFIRQVLEGCSWVSSVPGWGHTAVFFSTGELSHRGHALPHRHTAILVQHGPGCAKGVWPNLMLKRFAN